MRILVLAAAQKAPFSSAKGCQMCKNERRIEVMSMCHNIIETDSEEIEENTMNVMKRKNMRRTLEYKLCNSFNTTEEGKY